MREDIGFATKIRKVRTRDGFNVEVLPRGKRTWVKVGSGDEDDTDDIIAAFNNGGQIGGWGDPIFIKEGIVEARRTIVLSPSEKHRKALYDLKNTLDGLDQLSGFEYIGKRGKEPARAEFGYVDQESFDAALKEVEQRHKVSLTEG